MDPEDPVLITEEDEDEEAVLLQLLRDVAEQDAEEAEQLRRELAATRIQRNVRKWRENYFGEIVLRALQRNLTRNQARRNYLARQAGPNMSVFLTTARTDVEVDNLTAPVRANKRAALSVRDLSKLHEYATTSLPSKFGLMSTSTADDVAQLSNAYNVEMRIAEFTMHIKKYDMQEQFFNVLTPDPADVTKTLAETKNVMKTYSEMSILEVRVSNKYYKQYGPSYMLENLNWTQELLEKSCEQPLRDKVTEKLLDVPANEQGGPLFFLLMIKQITSTTEDATRAMILKLTNMTLRDIPGENVDTAISQIRTALTRLRTVNQVPHDIRKKLIEIFQRTSVENFKKVFETMENNRRIGIGNDNLYEEERILELAEATFHELTEQNQWTGAGRRSSYVVCWNCGQDGHIRAQCPSPARPQGEQVEGGRGGRGNFGRGGGRGGNGGRMGGRTPNTRGGGGGRGYGGRNGGGRGGQNGGRYNNNNGRGGGNGGRYYNGGGRTGGAGRDHQAHTARGRGGSTDPMFVPPQVRGQTEQHINGAQHSWCHWCTKWVLGHTTRTHTFPERIVVVDPVTTQVVVVPEGGNPPQAQFAATFAGTRRFPMLGN
jgi:hypothetical protein